MEKTAQFWYNKSGTFIALWDDNKLGDKSGLEVYNNTNGGIL